MRDTGIKNNVKLVAAYAEIFSPLKGRIQNDIRAGINARTPEYLNKILSEINCNNPTFSATIPICLERFNTRKLELIGSGVLLRIINRTFLLTAAHVIDHRENGTLMIPGQQGFMPTFGNFASMRLPTSGRREDDIWDVAYVWLEDACASQLHSDFTVLERPDISLEAVPESPTNYIFAGFPWRKGKIKNGGVQTQFQTCSGVEATVDEYGRKGLISALHIAIRFNRKQAFLQRLGRVVTAPLPDGMSGGGVYACTSAALKQSPARLPLIGIANGYSRDRSLMIATRLCVYVDCIFRNQPDLAALAEK